MFQQPRKLPAIHRRPIAYAAAPCTRRACVASMCDSAEKQLISSDSYRSSALSISMSQQFSI